MLRESDFHIVPDKPTKEPSSSETKAAVNGEQKQDVKKDIKDRDKKSTVKQQITIQSQTNNDKDVKKETSTIRELRENSVNSSANKEKNLKEIKKEERQREKEREREESEIRKREKEKRRERKAASPQNYYETVQTPTEKYYLMDHYEHERESNRVRDLSSVSNSSNGSVHRRSQEPPEHDRGLLALKSYEIKFNLIVNFFFG